MTVATFDSRCPVCDEMIREGDEIAADGDGECCDNPPPPPCPGSPGC